MPDELKVFAAGLMALALWLPAFAASAFAAWRANEFLRRLGVFGWLSRVAAAGTALVILLAWLPVYAFAMFSLLDLGILGSDSR